MRTLGKSKAFARKMREILVAVKMWRKGYIVTCWRKLNCDAGWVATTEVSRLRESHGAESLLDATNDFGVWRRFDFLRPERMTVSI